MSKNETINMTEGARDLLVSLQNGGEIPTESTEDHSPPVVWKRKTYNRTRRKNGAFVLQNKSNGLFMKRVVNTSKKTITRLDVALDKATLFRFDSLDSVINEVPGKNFEYFMVKRNDEKELILI